MTEPGGGAAGAGSLADEALRLIEAIGLLADSHGADHGRTSPGAAPGPGGDPSAECRICPVCRLIAAVRQMRPEVLVHLAAAGEELLAAAREFAASAPAPGSPATAEPTGASGPVDAAGAAGPADAAGAVGSPGGAGGAGGAGGVGGTAALPVRRVERIELD